MSIRINRLCLKIAGGVFLPVCFLLFVSCSNLVENRMGNELPILQPEMDERAGALEVRSRNRAFEGAPPVIPHELDDQRDTEHCLGCHGNAEDAEDIGAAIMPHELLVNCTQCHVESEHSFLRAAGEGVANTFSPMAEVRLGHRAMPGTPPGIQHSTLMRSNCLACHGPTGAEALRSSHPERQMCVQCHAISSELNQGVVSWDAEAGECR